MATEQLSVLANRFSPFPESPHVSMPASSASEWFRRLKKIPRAGPFMSQRRKVLQRDGVTYICYNATYIPDLPRNSDNIGYFPTVHPNGLGSPGWLNSRHPFLGFSPHYLRVEGLFRKLRDPAIVTLVEQTELGVYRLRRDIIDNWSQVELSLLALEFALARITPEGDNPWPIEFRQYNPPSYYGYQGDYANKALATRCAKRSRDAFRGLIASIRMYISINPGWRKIVKKDYGVPDTWLDELDRTHILERDHNGIFADCVGAFVHMYNSDSLSVVRKQIEYGMPIWIVWESTSDPSLYDSQDPRVHADWLDFYPRPEEFNSLRLSDRLGCVETSDEPPLSDDGDDKEDLPTIGPFESFTPRSSSVSYGAPIRPPHAPYLDAGQLHGETPYQFVARRNKELEVQMKKEDATARQVRIGREQNAKKKMRPGARGARCFRWEEVMGHFIREPINRSDVEDVWDSYSAESKVYNSYYNEWDLWEGFDRENGPTTGDIEEYSTGVGQDGHRLDDEEMEELDEWIAYSSTHPRRDLVPIGERRPVNGEPFAEPSTRAFGRQLSPKIQNALPTFFKENATRLKEFLIAINSDELSEPDVNWKLDADLAETARLRYGYVRRQDVNTSVVADNKRFQKCIIKMYESKKLTSEKFQLSNAIKNDIIELIESIEASNGNVDALPQSLCDLQARNEQFLATHASHIVQVEQREALTECSQVIDEHSIKQLRRTFNKSGKRPRTSDTSDERPEKRSRSSTTVFFVQRNSQEARVPAWTIVLTDPVSALECMRCRATDYKSLLKHLLQRGISLRTVQKDKQALHWSSRQPASALPIRLQINSLSNVDYIQYVQRVRSLVIGNKRVSRAALMSGGILWRLVVEVATFDHVLDGPSHEQLAAVLNVREAGSFTRNETYYDDTLTQYEEDIICGVFRSSEEDSHEAEQLWSFWPKRAVWETSSVNAGYWTSYNEEWFLDRRKRLLGLGTSSSIEGRAFQDARDASFQPLIHQRDWRVKLRGQKKLGFPVLKANQDLAISFLNKFL